MTATLTREQRRMALNLVRMDCDDDVWGTCMTHLFGVAEVLYHAGAEIPARWGYSHRGYYCDPIAKYHPGSLPCEDAHPGESECDWPAAEYVPFLDAGELGEQMLTYAGNVLDRWAGVIKRAGRDY